MTLKNINKYPQQARLLDFMFYQNMKPGQLGVFKTSFCRKHFHVKHAVFSETTRKLQDNSKFPVATLRMLKLIQGPSKRTGIKCF